MIPPRLPSAIFLGAALLFTSNMSALACACCSWPTQRLQAVEKFDAQRGADLARLNFAPAAKLLLGEVNDEGLPGLPNPEEDWSLAFAPQKDRLTFSLRDNKGHAGTLVFMLPKSLAVLLIDTRDGQDEGYGPPLYTEWTLTAPFRGDGIFRDASKSRNLTLVLQGRGSSCTAAETFTHWILSFGPNDNFAFYGTLEAPKP